MNTVSVLPMEVEEALLCYKQERFRDCCIEKSFPNPLLREDVLALLDMFCTVVYYPQPDEENNGFHITDMPFADGMRHHFVFINTAQTIEKQVFTAAHELGHIWRVDDKVIALGLQEDTPEIREKIINRFAAVLLMPKDSFSAAYMTELQKYKYSGGGITLLNMFRLIVSLMDRFFAPIKAVVYRLAELSLITTDVADLLLGNGGVSEEKISLVVRSLFADNGYVRFLHPTNRKYIDGLAELLDQAEQTGAVPPVKIQTMRQLFDLPQKPVSTEMEEEIPLLSGEEGDGLCS